MNDVNLRPINMHWVEEGDPYLDCCVHGGIYFQIDSYVVCDGNETEWTISTAAFNFLRSIFYDHALLGEEPLIPHCGFNMWAVKGQPDALYIPNCDTKVNWSIRHRGDQVIHEFVDGTTIETSLTTWKRAVCKFADEVYEFYQTAWPKVITDEDDRKGFELFMSLWQERRARANHDASSIDN